MAELNTDSCGLLATASTTRWVLIDEKLPEPRSGMNPQLAPTRPDAAAPADPLGETAGVTVLPQPMTAKATSTAALAGPGRMRSPLPQLTGLNQIARAAVRRRAATDPAR